VYAIIGTYMGTPTIWGVGDTPEEALSEARENLSLEGYSCSWSVVRITEDQARAVTKKGADGTNPITIGIEVSAKDWLSLGYPRA
jgi:hypothetical protein